MRKAAEILGAAAFFPNTISIKNNQATILKGNEIPEASKDEKSQETCTLKSSIRNENLNHIEKLLQESNTSQWTKEFLAFNNVHHEKKIVVNPEEKASFQIKDSCNDDEDSIPNKIPKIEQKNDNSDVTTSSTIQQNPQKNLNQIQNPRDDKQKELCSFCNQMYVQIFRHEKTCTLNPKRYLFECPTCGSTFTRKENCIRHITKVHNTNKVGRPLEYYINE